MSRRPLLAAVALAVTLAACGGTAEPGAAPATAAGTPAPAAAPSPRPTPTMSQQPEIIDWTDQPAVDLPVGIVPHRILIPAIGVDAPVTDLAITSTEVEVPTDFDDTGWWTQTRRPGEIGPAVIGGHVDSTTGPAVFFRLDQLEVGDEIIVSDAAGEEVVFVVDSGIQIDKYERPPEVFGIGEHRPELRLITCGGEFDPAEGHYTDNYVIFAHQADWDA